MKIPTQYPQKGTQNANKFRKRYLVIKRDGLKCRMCGEEEPEVLTIDHVIRQSDGGENQIENMQILCRKCHDIKDNCIKVYKAKNSLKVRKQKVQKMSKREMIFIYGRVLSKEEQKTAIIVL